MTRSEMAERVARAIVPWMDVFPAAATATAIEPAAAGWDDYSLAEKAIALGAAHAALDAISAMKRDRLRPH